MQHGEAARRAVEQIDHVVEARREHVDVLAIDRRDEALVDALIDGRRQQIGLVLDVLDRLTCSIDVLRIAEQLVEHLRGRREMRRRAGRTARRTFRRAGEDGRAWRSRVEVR